jgi:hypothetical protein
MRDTVLEEDRRYFKQHPKARYYDRAPHPAEYPPGSPAPALVRVFNLGQGKRVRIGLMQAEGAPESLEALFPPPILRDLRRAGVC